MKILLLFNIYSKYVHNRTNKNYLLIALDVSSHYNRFVGKINTVHRNYFRVGKELKYRKEKGGNLHGEEN